jgi:hypothetical protein
LTGQSSASGVRDDRIAALDLKEPDLRKGRRFVMELDKSQTLNMLRSRGDEQKAQQAETELPDKVDTDQHSGLLKKLGVNPQDLLGKGGLGGMLGG